MANLIPHIETSESSWKGLYIVGGFAAMLAAIIFRRNFGVEITLFSEHSIPNTAIDWFTLLQNNRLIGLFFLELFDIVNNALLSLVFMALYSVIRKVNKSFMVIATTFGLVGIAVYIASNQAFSMLSLSDRYAAAPTDAARSIYLAAGESLLSINNPGAIYQGTGTYVSFLLLAIAGLIISLVMRRSNLFNNITVYSGILASIFDLAYCIALAIVPAKNIYLFAVSLVPAAGLFLMIWHFSVGLKLYQIGTSVSKEIK